MTERLTRNADVVGRDIAGETLLIPIRGRLADLQRIFAIGDVARFIWDRLDGTNTVSAITDAVTATFDVAREEAERDVCEFVRCMLAEELISEPAT